MPIKHGFKVVKLGLASGLVVALAACGGGDPEPGSSSQANTSSSNVISSSSSSLAVSSSSSSFAPVADNFAQNGGVESGTTYWSGRGDAQVSRVTSEANSGSASLYVTNRGDYWHGATIDVGDLTPGNEYEVSVWVKLDSGEPDEIIQLTGKVVEDSDPDTYLEYVGVAEATATASGWVEISGTYIPDSSFDFFIIETKEGSELVSFYVDDFSIVGEVDPVSSSSASNSSSPNNTGDGLASLTNIPIGVAINVEGGSRDTLNSSMKRQIVAENFSQISVENEMKMNKWDGNNYYNDKAELAVQFARDNGLSMHGHTLVWHPCWQMVSWANNSSGYRQNLINHVRGVAGQYTDVIESWDVVNEALWEDYEDESGCTYENGGQEVNGVKYRKSAHFLGMGGPEYIALAFEEADEVAPNADLYYNDYNIENGGEKTEWMLKMVEDLKNAGVPIDGVGFQMHLLPEWPSLNTIRQAMKGVVDLGLKVKITEMDVRLNNRYDQNDSNDIDSCNGCPELQGQKQRYKDVIKAYFDVVPPAQRGGVTVWGIGDQDSWYGPVQQGDGGPDWPLLWDVNLNPKPAYDGFWEALVESN